MGLAPGWPPLAYTIHWSFCRYSEYLRTTPIPYLAHTYCLLRSSLSSTTPQAHRVYLRTKWCIRFGPGCTPRVFHRVSVGSMPGAYLIRSDSCSAHQVAYRVGAGTSRFHGCAWSSRSNELLEAGEVGPYPYAFARVACKNGLIEVRRDHDPTHFSLRRRAASHFWDYLGLYHSLLPWHRRY